MSVSDANLPVWDGNRDKLPELNQVFVYKNRRYLPFKFRGEVLILDIEKEDDAENMEILFAGQKSGNVMANVLIKTGIATVEEAAAAFTFTKSGFEAYKALMKKFLKFLEETRDEKTFKAMGVTLEEIDEIHLIFAEARVMSALDSIFRR